MVALGVASGRQQDARLAMSDSCHSHAGAGTKRKDVIFLCASLSSINRFIRGL